MLKELPFTGIRNAEYMAIRSEDIKFSPSGRIMAIVATNGVMYLFAVDTKVRPIRITKTTALQSGTLVAPHGIDFISERIVVVANRGAWLTFYRLPPVDAWIDQSSIEPIHEMNAPWFGAKGTMRPQGDRHVLCGPGSVRVRGNQMFVCCNNKSTLSVHPFKLWWRWIRTGKGSIVARDGLAIPDGIGLSRDHRWRAVGDHEHKRIDIYGRGNPNTRCTLTDPGLSHPHGMCFDPGGNTLYVADAGLREIHVFTTTDDWQSSMGQSRFKLPAVDDEAYRTTKASVGEKYAPLEGGVKGIDIDSTGTILATTCQNQMLRFFETIPVRV